MVRIRNKPAKLLDGIIPARSSSRKRKQGEGSAVADSTTKTVTPARSSKRSRNTNLPYQSPESVDLILSISTKQKGTAKKNEKTPKTKVITATPKIPTKPVKRLQKKAPSKSGTEVKPPVRRRLLKTPEPAKTQRDKVRKTVTKNVKKAVKQITKKKVKQTSAAAAVQVVADLKKQKLSRPKKSTAPDADDKQEGAKRTKKETPKMRKGKLNPRPELTNYEKDPTFESRLDVPFISTLAHSRLLIRAVILNDMKLFKKLVLQEPEKIYTVSMKRSAQHEEDVMSYILKHENKEAFKILHKIPDKVLKKFGECPQLMITDEQTGRGNHRMFGHALRQVAVGRGGKEGNDAFLYDRHTNYWLSPVPDFGGTDLVEDAIKMGASQGFVDFLSTQLSVTNLDYTEIHLVMRQGHFEHAGRAIAKANKQGGYGFNFLHEEALTKHTKDELTEFKPVSVTKKCTYDPRFTPLHCAAINPNVEILKELLSSMPDYNLADAQGWTVGHYAAVCCGPEPLKYLLQFGISVNALTTAKRGGDCYTLLHVAVAAGRTHNVKLILEHEKKTQKDNPLTVPDDQDDDKTAKKKMKANNALIQNDLRYRVSKHGHNALHMACERGHVDIVKLLLKAGTDAERPTPAKFDNRATPLMIATIHGHLDIVKVLVDAGAKVEAKDKRGRTAAHYAAINGQTHILSYLLRLGVNHLAIDTSGNTLLHYSTAYGWYFATLLLIEAGCPPNATSFWKMTPMAIAFMKGHSGLVTVLMKQEGVDVNARINDSTGRTLLLEICTAGWDFPRLKFLVEELKADPTCADFDGNTALHLVTTQQLRDHYVEDFNQKIKPFNQCVAYLIEKGCDPYKKNADDMSPILWAAKNNHFYFISKLLDLKVPITFEKDKSDNTLLHYIATHFSQADKVIFAVFTQLCDNPANLAALTQMSSTFNKDSGLTPFLLLLQNYLDLSVHYEEVKTKMLKVIDKFLEKITVDINAKIEKSKKTALHLTVTSPLLTKILEQNPFLDPLDDELQTPLVLAITGKNYTAAEKLIDAGASVHFKFKNEFNVSLLLYYAMKETTSFCLVPKLIQKGANPHEIQPKTKNSLLHYIARKPTLQKSCEALQAILDAGVSPNLINCDGRTPLHLAVNQRGSETDVFYDIEDALITAGANLGIKDHRGRTALHYAFVKIGSPTDTTFFDPIELVSHLVTSMKGSGHAADIHCKDVYGSTALHYSGFRGATICSSLLIQTLGRGEIDTIDSNGNTPFALAVRNQHEGCALNFYQKDADFLRTINNEIKVIEVQRSSLPPGTSAGTKSDVWLWEHISRENEEKERLREQREKYPILEQVVKHNWQGLLYLMIGQLQTSGVGFSTGISTALKTLRLKLALKLTLKVKQKKELAMVSGTLFHSLAKYYQGGEGELMKKICEAFWKLGLDHTATDEFGTQSVIYSVANHQVNLSQILVSDKTTLALMKADLFGRTPFTALFWQRLNNFVGDAEVQEFAEMLLTSGADPNQLCEYPFALSSFPGVQVQEKLTDIIPSNNTRYPPLIVAVIMNCPTTVKWLLNVKPGSHPVNVNVQDSEGRTAIIHAVRLNNYKMAKLLLDPKGYKYEEDMDGTKPIRLNKSCNVDVKIKDKQGYTVMDHLIMSPDSHCHYSNIGPMFRLLQQLDAVNIVSGDGLKPIDRALRQKRWDMFELFSKYVQLPTTLKQLAKEEYPDFAPSFSQDIMLLPISDFDLSSKKMADILIEKAKKTLKDDGLDDDKPEPDPLCGLDKQNAEVMVDAKQNIPYDIIMTKVDLNYGVHGLYNFYKMQLIKQPRGKEMIILFTQWGRVGDEGQYQKTPFPTEEEAIKEFMKIFRTKSGNAWDDVQNFTPVPTKYRLVKKDLRLVKYSTQMEVNFKEMEKAEKLVRSSLPGSITTLIKSLCEVHKPAEPKTNGSSRYYHRRFRHRSTTDPNYDNLPLMAPHDLLKGEVILKEIGSRLVKNKEMENDTKGKYTEKDKLEVMSEIAKLSEDFYQLIPVYGYSTEKLEPIFSEDDLRQKLISISRLIHLGLAKSLMLAAQYHQTSTNPFEYVYRCLGTKIQLLDRANSRDREEAEMVLQYVHNTGERVKVKGVYRVQIPSEDGRLTATNIHNRQLLWHGTNSTNLLSILQKGLQVAPLSAEISGHLFGKGVYMADIFAKSQKYCSGVTVDGKTRKYMLLCEAALGRIYEVKLSEAGDKPMPSGYNCIKSAGCKYHPNPEATVTWKGRTVALGEKTAIHYIKEDYWRLDYNEYIIFNTDQIAIRYLVEYED